MSDNEEFLGDDFGDPSVDDTYNLGNEEEEILLAGGNISDCISNNDLRTIDNQKEDILKINTSSHTHDDVYIATDNKVVPEIHKSHDISVQSLNEGEDVKVLINEEEIIPLNDSMTNNRYRADQNERFPTERSELHGINLANIPDSLDTIMTAEKPNNSFRNRKQNNNKGKRMNNQRPVNDFKRPDFQRSPHFKNSTENYGRNINNSRSYPPDFRPHPRDLPLNRGIVPIPPLMHDFHSNNFNMPNNLVFRSGPEDPRFSVFRPLEPRSGNFRHENNRPFHNVNSRANMGPNNIEPHSDMHSAGTSIHRDFRPMLSSNTRHFNQYRDNFSHPNHSAEFPPIHDRPSNERYMPRIESNINNFGPSNFDTSLENNKVNHPGSFHHPKNYSNTMPNYNSREFEKKNVANDNFDQLSNQCKTDPKIGTMSESKKVLINPHFKGAVPTDIQNDRPLGLNNYQSFGNNPHNANSNIHIQNKPHESTHYRMGEPNLLSRVGNNTEPVNEKELERLTEQFIHEQQVCFRQNDTADFYEKTQRFIENTSLPSRSSSQSLSIELDYKKEYLKRKQEEFINENTKLLNLRRRRNTPPRPIHRSPPPRHRTSPYRRLRGRLSTSPIHNRREQSGEPEDKAYRAKLREQAEMRARVLQAKERRRRRDAANLADKMNQPSTVTLSPKSEKPQTLSAVSINDKRQESDTYVSNKNNPEPFSNKNVDTKDSLSDEKAVKNHMEECNVQVSAEKIDNVKQPNEDTFEDMLEEDLLHLSPEDEELLLSDEDDLIPPINFPKTNPNFNKSENKFSENSHTNKCTSKPMITAQKSLVSNKRTANIDMKEDLRAKLKKTNESNEEKSLKTQVVSPRRRIVFSNEISKKSSLKSQSSIRGDKNESDQGNVDKWRSTFNEQKLDLTAPVAARAISAVMRNSTENKKKTLKNKATNCLDSVNLEKEKKSDKVINGSDTKSWNGRQVVVAKTARRVVIPPRQKPLVVIENDDEESEELCEQVNKGAKNKKTALVTGLPPGMTEARLLSLCGPEVEHVIVGAAGSADVSFNTAEACERFIRRFHGRLVAACRLTVTAAI